MTIPERGNNPALISVSLKFGSRVGRGAWPVYAVYVDGRPVGSCPYREVAAILIGDGRHSVGVRISPWVSDSLDLDLAGGDHAELVCDMKPLIRNRFLKLVETKFLLFAVPVALLSMVYPEVTALVEKHAKFEFLGIIFLTCLGGLLGMKNVYSKRTGAMLSLMERSTRPADGSPRDGTPSEAVAREMSRLIKAGAWPFHAEAATTEHDARVAPPDSGLDLTAANLPIPLPALLILAVLDLACVFAITFHWFPPRPTPLFFAVTILNGVMIGLLLGVQTWLWTWARKSSLARRASASSRASRS